MVLLGTYDLQEEAVSPEPVHSLNLFANQEPVICAMPMITKISVPNVTFHGGVLCSPKHAHWWTATPMMVMRDPTCVKAHMP